MNNTYPPCPKCNGVLEKTETEGLWCDKGGYESEFELWKALQLIKKEEK